MIIIHTQQPGMWPYLTVSQKSRMACNWIMCVLREFVQNRGTYSTVCSYSMWEFSYKLVFLCIHVSFCQEGYLRLNSFLQEGLQWSPGVRCFRVHTLTWPSLTPDDPKGPQVTLVTSVMTFTDRVRWTIILQRALKNVCLHLVVTFLNLIT